MPVLARIMDMLALLLFLTFNGHLWLISLLVDTFHTLPIGGEPLNSNAFLALTKAGSLIFLNGLMLYAAYYSAADPESGIRFTESYGPAIIHFCYWISINSDCRYLFNGGINAVNCAFLRTFIQ